MNIYKKPNYSCKSLNYLYFKKKYSIRDIAKLLNREHSVIRAWMDKCGIKRRSIGEAKKTPLARKKHHKAMSMEKHPNWKGGRVNENGYIKIKKLNHPHRNKSGYIREHRLIMERYLKRFLQPHEIIHHKNGIKDDNRIENLELSIKGRHSLKYKDAYDEGYKDGFKEGHTKAIIDMNK